MDRFRKNYSGYSSLAVIALSILCFILIKDSGTTAALCWLAVVFCVSFFMRAFLPTDTENLPDSGFAISFGVGFFLCFYVAWMFSALTGFEFADAAVFGSFVILAAISFWIKRYVKNERYITKEEFNGYLKAFAVFSVIFLAFYWMIGFNPSVDPGTENYMDFGFMQTIYRQKSAYPYDLWFAKEKLNYYYLGQAAAVYLTRLAATTPEYGYNLTLCTFIAMTFLMVYELAAYAADRLLPDIPRKGRAVRLGGVFGGSLAAFAGNPHWLLYGLIVSPLGKVLGNGEGGYWFSDGTVYINTIYGDPDNGKNEFPAYSVILGDLHAHVINVIFVLPLLAILFDLCMKKEGEDRKKAVWQLVLISMLLGYYKGANYWDFAIYFVITGAMIVFSDIKRRGMSVKTMLVIASKAIFVTAVSFVSILPFTFGFDKMESGVLLCEDHSPFGKLAVLWLIPVLITISLITYMYSSRGKETIENKPARSALLAFALCTIGLVIVPEVVYVKDIYGGSNKRFNTMFKLTYQAFILFAIIAGIAFAVSLFRVYSDEKRTGFFSTLLVVFAVSSVLYTPYAAYKWFGHFWDKDARIGISSIEGLRRDDFYRFEMDEYDVLMQDDKKVLNIVEVAGNSYSHESALSAYTGACTPAGWFVHEWMWHNDPDPIKERSDQVIRFYSSGDQEYCRKFLKKYDIDYILVGPAEVIKYPVNRNGFWNLGDCVIDEIWQDVELALIKVDRSKL